MNKHLTFDEMVDFVYATKVTDDTIQLAQKVNSHIFTCKECREVFDSIRGVKEITGDMIRANALKLATTATTVEKVSMLDKFVASISLVIKDKKNLLIDKINNLKAGPAFDFGYPVALATRGTGQIADTGPSILIDEDNEFNQISYVDGCLSIQLDAMDWQHKVPEVMLLDENGAVVAYGAMTKDDEYYIKEIAIDDIDKVSIYIG